MDRVEEEALKKQGYDVVEEEGGKLLVKSKEDKLFLVKQIEKDEHVEECLKRSKHVHFVETKLFEEYGKTYLLMEQCSGGTLYDKIQAHKEDNEPFSEKEVMVWLVKICMALVHLHTDGIPHRLLISQNIFFTGETVRLGETAELHERDGLEKPTDTNGNQPPEVQEGRPYTIHSDVYALGCLMYEMCTLEKCVQVNTDVISSIRRGSRDFLINFSSGLLNLLADMLHPDPECRPSVSDFPAKAIVFAHMDAQVKAILKDVKVSLKKLNQLAKSVEDVHLNTTCVSLAGGAIGVTGGFASIAGVMGAAGLALAPFTLGTSMMLTTAGVCAGLAGGLISVGSNITNTVSQNNTFQQIRIIITDLVEKTANVDISIQHLIEGIEVFKNVPHLSSYIKYAGLLTGFYDDLFDLAIMGVGKSSARWAKNLRFAGAYAGAFAGVGLALDAISFTVDAMEIKYIQQAKGKNMSKDDIKLIQSKTMKFAAEVRQTTKDLQKWLDNRSNLTDLVSKMFNDQ